MGSTVASHLGSLRPGEVAVQGFVHRRARSWNLNSHVNPRNACRLNALELGRPSMLGVRLPLGSLGHFGPLSSLLLDLCLFLLFGSCAYCSFHATSMYLMDLAS